MNMNKNLRFEENLPSDEYGDFCQHHPHGNLLQSSPWSLVKAEWASLRVGLRREDNSLAAACQILVRPLALTYTFWYIPLGPLLDYEEEGVLETLLTHISFLARRKRCVFIRVHPPIPIRMGSIAEFREGKSRELFNVENLDLRMVSCGYTPGERSLRMASTTQPRFQAVIYREDWQEPPAGKIGYNLRLNDRYRVSAIRAGEEGLDSFSELIRKTEERQKIRLRDRSYFSRILQAFGDDAFLLLAHFNLKLAQANALEREESLKAELESLGDSAPKKQRSLEEQLISVNKDLEFYKSLENVTDTEPNPSSADFSGQLFMSRPESNLLVPAGVLVVISGKRAEMLYACSDERYERLPAVWKLYTEGIRAAFAGGCTKYYLGGLEGSLDDGLATFKSQFSPRIEETAGEYDFAIRPMMYRSLLYFMKKRDLKRLKAQSISL